MSVLELPYGHVFICQELLALQGFNPAWMNLGPGDYGVANMLAGCLYVRVTPKIAGNAMTTSILSAGIFSIMCWALPAKDGIQLMRPPSPARVALGHDHSQLGSTSPSESKRGEISEMTEEESMTQDPAVPLPFEQVAPSHADRSRSPVRRTSENNA